MYICTLILLTHTLTSIFSLTSQYKPILITLAGRRPASSITPNNSRISTIK